MQMLGHDGPPAAFWRENLITDAPLERCPVRTLQLAREADPAIAREVDRYADDYYPNYKAGIPRLIKGGIADQPARYLAIISVFQAMETAVEAKALALSSRKEEQ